MLDLLGDRQPVPLRGPVDICGLIPTIPGVIPSPSPAGRGLEPDPVLRPSRVALPPCRTLLDQAPPEPESPEQRIVQVLAQAEEPLLQAEIRKRAGARNETVTAALRELVREGRVERGPGGRYRFLGAVANQTAIPTARANA